MKINIKFDSSLEDFHLGLREESDFCMEFEAGIASKPCVPYEGPYVVIPKVTDQALPTEDRHCAEDIHVLKIPYYEVANVHGKTAVIGG